MIFDKIENINRYGLNLRFVQDDLEKHQFGKGKFEIEGLHAFGIDLEYETKLEDKALWEAHRKYLDIHVLLEGEEYIHINDINNMKSSKEYEDDYELFDGMSEQSIHLRPGYFLVLFPNEVHKTSILVNNSITVKKKVYKSLL